MKKKKKNVMIILERLWKSVLVENYYTSLIYIVLELICVLNCVVCNSYKQAVRKLKERNKNKYKLINTHTQARLFLKGLSFLWCVVINLYFLELEKHFCRFYSWLSRIPRCYRNTKLGSWWWLEWKWEVLGRKHLARGKS